MSYPFVVTPEARTVSCMAQYFSPIALMLDRYTNMPYLMWEMKPKAVNHTLLTICGAVMEISIEIKVCCFYYIGALLIEWSPGTPMLPDFCYQGAG